MREVEKKENHFSMETQFSSWLAQQKKLWVTSFQSKPPSVKKNNLQSMFSKQDSVILNKIWHIVQIVEQEPGIFKVWMYLESGSLISIRLTIPRTIYINSYKAEAGDNFRPVKKRLPREKQVHHLYEFSMEERDFISTYSNFDYFKANPDFEGIYETQLPLAFKLMTSLGNVVKLQKKTINDLSSSTGYANHLFEQHDFYPLFDYDKNYLPNLTLP